MKRDNGKIHVDQVGRRTGKQSLRRSLALDQRGATQIEFVEAKQVNSLMDQTVGAPGAELTPQGLEI